MSRRDRKKTFTQEQPVSRNNVPDDAEQSWQDFLDERKILVEGLSDAAKSFDQAMLTLSGGALGLSITFIQQIAPQPRNTELLRDAWISLGMALFITLSSFLVSQFAFMRQMDISERTHLKKQPRSGIFASWIDNVWSVLTVALNISSIVSFAIGVYFLARFSFVNLP